MAGGVAGRDAVGVMDLWSRYSGLGCCLSRSDAGVFEWQFHSDA